MYCPTSYNDRSYSVAGGEPLESLNLQQMYDLKEPEYLIDGLMIDGGVYSVVASPGIGKSWIEQKVALAVAMGRPFHGRTAKRGTVVRLVSERFALAAKRLRDWRSRYPQQAAEIDPNQVFHFPEPIELHNPHSVERLIRDLEEKGINPSLISVDTLHMNCLGTDENSASQMGLVLAGISRLRKRFNCTILLVHHTGKDGKSERGSNSFRGYLDGLWQLSKRDGLLVLRCVKENWGPGFTPMHFQFVSEEGRVTLEDVVATKAPDKNTNTDAAARETSDRARRIGNGTSGKETRDVLALAAVSGAGGRTTRKAVAEALQVPGEHQVAEVTAYRHITTMLRAGTLAADGPEVFVPLATPLPAAAR